MKRFFSNVLTCAVGRIYDHPWLTIMVILLLSLVMLGFLGELKIDTSSEGLLLKSDRTRQEYNRFRKLFGRDEVIVAAVRMPEKPDIPFFRKLRNLHEDLEKNVSGIEDVTSLIDARHLRGNAESLVVETLFDKDPDSRKDLDRILRRMDENPLYVNTLISSDKRFTALVIETKNHSSRIREDGPARSGVEDFSAVSEITATPFLTDEENSEIVSKILETVKKHRHRDFQVVVSGSPVISHFLNQSIISQMGLFTVAAVIVIVMMLFVIFRHIAGVILPLIVVALSLLFTFATMALSGFPVTLVSQILPSFILTVGMCDSIHVLALFFKAYNVSGDKRAALIGAYTHSGKALFLTSLTTFLGLLSFASAEIGPVSQFGIYTACGVLYAFLFTLLVIPAALSVIPVKIRKDDGRRSFFNTYLFFIGKTAADHPKTVGIITLLLLITSLFPIRGLSFSHNILTWFPENHDVRTATEIIDREMRGTTGMDILIDTQSKGGLYDPGVLDRIDQAVSDVEGMAWGDVFVGKAWAVTTLIKEINRALGGGNSAMYKIPHSEDLVAQELFLFENSGSDDLSDMVDQDYRIARVSLKAPFIDAVKYSGFMDDIMVYFRRVFPDAVITVTGTMPVLFRTVTATIKSMSRSFLTAFLMIGMVMIVSMGDLRLGLISLVPNSLPIVLSLGVIGVLEIPIDLFIVLIGNIAIGLVVDDTIHFIHHFSVHFRNTGNRRKAIMMTYESAGTSMVITSVILCLGFMTFTLSSMNNLFHFGVLTSIVIALALAADLVVTPSIIMILYKDNNQGEENGHSKNENQHVV